LRVLKDVLRNLMRSLSRKALRIVFNNLVGLLEDPNALRGRKHRQKQHSQSDFRSHSRSATLIAARILALYK
jgi:hypothetical protein